ncbi:efflux RND transporter periplasmic adaptor subunit [Micrococcus luteus]
MNGPTRPLLALFSGALALSGCTSAPDPASESPTAPAAAQTITVERGDLTSVLVVTGTLVDRPEYALAAPEAGTIALGNTSPDEPVKADGPPVVRVGNVPLSTPHDGLVADLPAPEGTRVGRGATAAVIRHGGLAVQLQVPAEQAYRVATAPTSAKTTIEGGPGGLDCALAAPVAAPEDTGQDSTGSAAPYSALCLLPLDTEAVPGLPARVGLQLETREDVLTLPLSAVSGRQGSGEVAVLSADGTVERRPVGLGVSDGTLIEITEGLAEGDEVTVAAPGFE